MLLLVSLVLFVVATAVCWPHGARSRLQCGRLSPRRPAVKAGGGLIVTCLFVFLGKAGTVEAEPGYSGCLAQQPTSTQTAVYVVIYIEKWIC